jgi:hypothetical protein
MSTVGIQDMVFNRGGDGKITAGGFKINNNALSGGKPALMSTGGGKKQTNKKASDLMSGYAVPSGLFYMQEHLDKNYTTVHSNEVIEPELYDTLLSLANSDNKVSKKKSKKSNAGKTKQKKVKTKKNRR